MGMKGYIASQDGRTYVIGTNKEEVQEFANSEHAAPLFASTMEDMNKHVDMLLRMNCDVVLLDQKDERGGNGNV